MKGTLTIAKKAIFGILIFQLVFFRAESRGGGTTSAAREAPKGSASRRLPTLKQQKSLMRDAVLDSIGQTFALLDSPEILRDFLLSTMTPKEREEMRPLLMQSAVKFVPRREGDALILESGTGKFVVRWPKFPASTFNINGVDWTISSHQSLRFNVDLLIKLLAQHGKHARFGSLFLDEAHAVPAWLVTLGAVALGAFLGKFVEAIFEVLGNVVCVHFHDSGETMRVNCLGALQRQAAAKKALEDLSAVKSEVAVKKRSGGAKGVPSERVMWIPDDKVKSCPVGKNQNTYIADVLMTKVQKGVMQQVGDWQTVKFELEPGTGTLKNGVVVPAGTDINSNDLTDSAKAIFEFEEQGLKTVYVPNPQRENVESPPMVPIKMSQDSATLKPWEAAEKTKWVEMVAQVNALISACVVADARAKVKGTVSKPAQAPQPAALPSQERPSLLDDTSKLDNPDKPKPDRAPQGRFD